MLRNSNDLLLRLLQGQKNLWKSPTEQNFLAVNLKIASKSQEYVVVKDYWCEKEAVRVHSGVLGILVDGYFYFLFFCWSFTFIFCAHFIEK